MLILRLRKKFENSMLSKNVFIELTILETSVWPLSNKRCVPLFVPFGVITSPSTHEVSLMGGGGGERYIESCHSN